MSNEPFNIKIDIARKLIMVTCAGLWDTATVGHVDRDMQTAIDTLRTRGGGQDLLILIDRRLQGPQTQDVVAALQRVAQNYTPKALRTAILTKGALSKLQTDRIGSGFSIFSNESDAMHWLLTGVGLNNAARPAEGRPQSERGFCAARSRGSA